MPFSKQARLAAMVALLAPAICVAQADVPVSRPEVKAGDRWVYNRMDYWQNRVTGRRNISGTNRFTLWYVPEVKRWVKLMYEDEIISGGPRGPNNKFGEELVEFKVQ